MAEESDDQEKTEAATPRRLEKAREEGQVARSRELTTFLLLLAGVGGLWSLSSHLYGHLGMAMEQSFLFDRSQAFETAPMLTHVLLLARKTLSALLPLFLLLLVVALVAELFHLPLNQAVLDALDAGWRERAAACLADGVEAVRS